MKIVHLSDLHLTKDDSALENQMATQIREAILYKYQNDKVKILITGDITDNGDKAEYNKAIEILSPLNEGDFKLIICPGNHDYGKNGIHYRDKARNLFLDKIEKELLKNSEVEETMEKLYPKVTPFPEDKVVFFGVDSTEGRLEENAFRIEILAAEGEVGEEQRDQLASMLTDSTYAGFTKVVYLHNHPWSVIPRHRLLDAPEFREVISEKTDILLFGHVHTSKMWDLRDGMLALNAGKSTEPFRDNGKYYLGYREILFLDKKSYIAFMKISIDKKFITEGISKGDMY